MKKNLSNNKEAMLALKYMIKCGLSNIQISQKLYSVFGHQWSTSCISRKRIALQQMDITCTPAEKTTAPIKPTRKKSTPVKQKTNLFTPTSIENYFRGTDPDTLSFESLCEYTASFFDKIANLRGTGAPQMWWDTIRDKIFHWNAMRETTNIILSDLTKSQRRAYNFCSAMYNKSITGEKHYREVYSLYREWRGCFLATTR